MAVLSRDDYFKRINAIVGTSTTDDSIKFVEDMTDTYNSLEKQANGDGVNWKQKYDELDASWRTRYQQRFFSGNGASANPDTTVLKQGEEEITAETIQPEDLFKEE